MYLYVCITAVVQEEEVVNSGGSRHGRDRKGKNNVIYIFIKFLKIKRRKRPENGAYLLLQVFTSMIYGSHFVHGILLLFRAATLHSGTRTFSRHCSYLNGRDSTIGN